MADSGYQKMYYRVLSDGKEMGRFLEMSMDALANEPIEYLNKLYQGKQKDHNITLKKGRVTKEFIAWIQANNTELKTIIIELYDKMNRIVNKWEITNAWSIMYTLVDSYYIDNEILIERVELSYEDIKHCSL